MMKRLERLRSKVLLVALIAGGVTVLPLMLQVWLVGYCLSCMITSCPKGCVDGKVLGRPFAVCALCEISDPQNPYACTACNFVNIECVPVNSAYACPPYRQDVQPFVNMAGPRPFDCVPLDSILLCVMK